MSTTDKMWTSKLGNKYPKSLIEQNDKTSQKELKRLRGLKCNSICADCDRQDNTWASVSHGVFICITCSDVHRSVGTHITKVKGCTGTYLWGPDELEKMQTTGNRIADEIYGTDRVDPSASKEQKQRYVTEKYEKRTFAAKSACVQAKPDVIATKASIPAVRRAEQVSATPASPQVVKRNMSAAPPARAIKVTDNLFDDFFNEEFDSCFGHVSMPLTSSEPRNLQATEQPTSQPLANSESDLDAFLNTALCANTQVKTASMSGYPMHLDPFSSIQKDPVTDPFADWATF